MEYNIVRMRRKTLAISITDGVVTVKAPRTTSVEYIEDFVGRKSDWIQKKLAEHSRKTAYLRSVLDYASVLYRGEQYVISDTSEFKRIKCENGILYLPQKYAEKDGGKAAVCAWYKRTATKELEARLNEISAVTSLAYKTFRLTNARTKWGSCDGDCNIRLNWRLVMLPPYLIDYVIVHELAHTKHHDHSAEFWKTVGSFYSEYKAARNALKTYSVLTSLYR